MRLVEVAARRAMEGVAARIDPRACGGKLGPDKVDRQFEARRRSRCLHAAAVAAAAGRMLRPSAPTVCLADLIRRLLRRARAAAVRRAAFDPRRRSSVVSAEQRLGDCATLAAAERRPCGEDEDEQESKRRSGDHAS